MNKDPYIVLEYAPLTILDSKSDICMSNNGNYTKHTRHIAKRLNFVRNGEKWNMNKVDWCEVGLKISDIVDKNIG